MSKTKIKHKKVCPNCNGGGKSYGAGYCSACRGRGKVTEEIIVEGDLDVVDEVRKRLK